jgi:transposase
MKETKHPQWALQHRKPGTELRLINGKYYLYQYKTVYDKDKKRPRKITGKLIGRITQKEGLIPSGKRKLEESLKGIITSKPVCKEYGVSSLLLQQFSRYISSLQKAFPEQWKAILQIAYCRFLYRCPIKNIPFRLAQSYLPELIQAKPFNEKTASVLLKTIGGMHQEKLVYMKSFIRKEEHILMDATNIFSHSSLITLARKGYNNQMHFDPQFNLLYLYSAKTAMPVYYRLLPGNIREVKAFKNCILEAGLKDAIVVADKGFFSSKNIELLLQEKLRFILPLKRDNALIDYSDLEDNTFKQDDRYFEHEKRIIWFQEYTWNHLHVNIYLDESLRINEEKDYLQSIQTHPENYTLQEYHQIRNTFGTIVLLSNLRRNAKEIYQIYKSRMAIELLFDGMKNVLEADHTYMQDEQTLHGWMFINHITLQWYQHLYIELKNRDLLKKYSVNDLIQMLSDLKMIKINDSWHLNEITNYAKRLFEKFEIPIETLYVSPFRVRG